MQDFQLKAQDTIQQLREAEEYVASLKEVNAKLNENLEELENENK